MGVLLTALGMDTTAYLTMVPTLWGQRAATKRGVAEYAVEPVTETWLRDCRIELVQSLLCACRLHLHEPPPVPVSSPEKTVSPVLGRAMLRHIPVRRGSRGGVVPSLFLHGSLLLRGTGFTALPGIQLGGKQFSAVLQ